jgi:hypothetical protein
VTTRRNVNPVDAFQRLAQTIGLEFPQRLATLMELAHTLPEDTVLASFGDFRWRDADEAEREIEEWLNPDDQPGQVFLPFATNAGGESFCLIRLQTGVSGIGQILHFDQPADLYADISQFITCEYVRTAADLSDLEPQTDVAATLANEVALIRAVLLPEHDELLHNLFARPCVARSYWDGPRSEPRTVHSFISQDEEQFLLGKLIGPDPVQIQAFRNWEH